MLSNILLVFGLGGAEVGLIVFAVLVLFGAKKIPELARGFGRGIREFKDATREVSKEIEDASNEVKKN
jgi:sec-independent protein translocase protein TatA